MRIVVTGGTGKAGRWVVRDLRDHGHEVLNVDARHDGSPHGQCLVADLADDVRFEFGLIARRVERADESGRFGAGEDIKLFMKSGAESLVPEPSVVDAATAGESLT